MYFTTRLQVNNYQFTQFIVDPYGLHNGHGNAPIMAQSSFK